MLIANRRVSRPAAEAFATNREGSIAIITALCIVLIASIAGGAVDYGRWHHSRITVQNALDAAVLAGGRQLQVTSGNRTKAIESARSTYRSMQVKYVTDDTIAFNVAESGLAIQATGNAYVATPFMGLLGMPKLPLFGEAKGVHAQSTWVAGSESGTSIEMSLMLDTTGSMAGQKIQDLREAAADMVDIVVWDNQSSATSRMALAPFASTVNVGDAIDKLIDPAIIAANKHATKAKCVVERVGAEAATDAAPGEKAWLSSYNVTSGSSTSSCPEDVEIMPLTSNKSALKSAIGNLKAQGSTAGALGTAWAWYLLSPNWNPLWSASSAAVSYETLSEVGPSGRPKVQKIAVLMTDGTYNTFLASQHSDRSKQATDISSQAVDICKGMKQKGIIVYTVGFQLDNDLARTTLRDCATAPGNFYEAKDGNALRTAFRDIAIRTSPLRLSH